MTPSGKLALHPERCDRCGACMKACPHGSLRVASGYIYVDVVSCDGCFACGETCTTGAIVHAGSSAAASVVVGSRAEAKALRKSAAQAAAPAARQPRSQERRVADHGADKASHVARWSIAEAGAIAAVLLAGLFAKDALLGSSYITSMPESGQMIARAVVLSLYYSMQIAAVVMLAARSSADTRRAVGLKGPADARTTFRDQVLTVGLVVALLVATRALYLVWGAFAQAIGWAPPLQDTNRLTELFGSGSIGLFATVVLVVLVGPLAEEMVFRGTIQSALAGRWGARLAVVGSSAIFAAYHVSPWTWFPMFALGLATGWLAQRSRTLWPAIALHSLYNGVVVLAAFWVA